MPYLMLFHKKQLVASSIYPRIFFSILLDTFQFNGPVGLMHNFFSDAFATTNQRAFLTIVCFNANNNVFPE